MSLPASQLRALGSIEGRLRAADPHLASMFAIFARLNADEPVAAEPLASRLWLRWPRPRANVCAVVLIPVIFIALVVAGALSGGPRIVRACVADYPAGTSSPLANRPVCQLTADNAAVKMMSLPTAAGAENPACLTIARPAPAANTDARGWACYK
jgi:hypothetical protein